VYSRSVYRRRIQKVGKSTYIVSLPVSWIRSLKLDAKSEVLMEAMPDGSLRVIPASAVEAPMHVRVYNIEFACEEGDPEELVRSVIAAYISGASIIRVSHSGCQDIIKRGLATVRDKIMGVELIDEDSTSATLQIVVDPSFTDVPSTASRMVRLAYSMHMDLVAFLENRVGRSVIDAVIARDDLVDKLYILTLRLIVDAIREPFVAVKRGVSPVEAHFYGTFVKTVERVADHAVAIARVIEDVKALGIADLADFYRAAADLFKDCAEAFMKSELQTVRELAKKARELKNYEELVRAEVMARQSPQLQRFLDSVSRVVARSIDIIEEVYDLNALRKG